MPNRDIDTGYWSHPFVFPLSLEAKTLYIYLFSNSHDNQAGLYRINLEMIAFETRVTNVEAALKELEKRVRWYPEHQLIWVKNFLRRQGRSPKFLIAAAKCLTELHLPNDVVNEYLSYNDSISIPYPYTLHTLSVGHQKTKHQAQDAYSTDTVPIPSARASAPAPARAPAPAPEEENTTKGKSLPGTALRVYRERVRLDVTRHTDVQELAYIDTDYTEERMLLAVKRLMRQPEYKRSVPYWRGILEGMRDRNDWSDIEQQQRTFVPVRGQQPAVPTGSAAAPDGDDWHPDDPEETLQKLREMRSRVPGS